MQGINIRIKSREAHIADFKTSLNFLEIYKLNENMINIWHLQFYLLAI